EVVQVGGRKAAAIQRHQRAQLGRDDRNDGHNHPLWLVARDDELLDDLQALGELLGLKFSGGLSNFHAQVSRDLLEIEGQQDIADGFGADLGGEAVGTIFVLGVEELLFGQQLVLGEGRQARIENDIVLEIQNPLDVLQRHVEQ